jgi:hypothetical protein
LNKLRVDLEWARQQRSILQLRLTLMGQMQRTKTSQTVGDTFPSLVPHCAVCENHPA